MYLTSSHSARGIFFTTNTSTLPDFPYLYLGNTRSDISTTNYITMTAALRIARAARSSTTKIQSARFSAIAQRMAEGSTGATRSGGAAQGDAFQKREEASENLYIKQQEAEKLKALKAKIEKSKGELAQHEKDLSELEKK
ncbi:hypothetical protein CAC42_4478 [Sphaceloma murrayae]|uniref:ATPase inhibitor, mitochondrial n=1 Tax=Sphaceloma murrayae TaxID=2082308 RepID=A0A2K1QLQ0_9PEZI|nr:hypothetical protein CAC42_4478 [Sphaceloma murrayae]